MTAQALWYRAPDAKTEEEGPSTHGERWLEPPHQMGRSEPTKPWAPATIRMPGVDQWWPSLDGAVLFAETSEEAPPPEIVARFLRSLAVTGELQRLAGLVLGRPGGEPLTHEDRLAYDQAVLDVVRGEYGVTSLSIVTNVDFGHTDPMWTIPQAVPVRFDPATRRIASLEAGIET